MARSASSFTTTPILLTCLTFLFLAIGVVWAAASNQANNTSDSSGDISPSASALASQRHDNYNPPLLNAMYSSNGYTFLVAVLARIQSWLWAQVSTSAAFWRTLAIIFAASSVKNIPFVWHARVFGTMFYHMYAVKHFAHPNSLFAPAITVSKTPLTEIDWNIHKSNSTYYSDLDIARTHLVTIIVRRSLIRKNRYETHLKVRNQERKKDGRTALPFSLIPVRVQAPPTEKEIYEALTQEAAAASAGCPFASMVAEKALSTGKMTYMMQEVQGNHAFALGGTSTFFYREIPPLTTVEFWTRLVSWDRKWLYIVTHIVKKDEWSKDLGKQGKWLLQPWKNLSATLKSQLEGKPNQDTKANNNSAIPLNHPGFQQNANSSSPQSAELKLSKTLYATSVSRYVLKKGKITVPPELLLRRGDMLPDKPEWAPMSTELPDADQIRNTVRDYLAGQESKQQQDKESEKPVDTSSPASMAQFYVDITKRTWQEASPEFRENELNRRASMEPGTDVDDAAYIPPVPESVKLDDPAHLDWEEVERRRVMGLLSIGDSVSKLDGGLMKAFKGDDERAVFGLYWDF